MTAGHDTHDEDSYVISDERFKEIKGLINWSHAGWQTIPKQSVTVYQLAAAIEDFVIEREESRRG